MKLKAGSLIIAVSAVCSATALHAATLPESVMSALTESPAVAKSLSRVKGAAEDIVTAKARSKPNVIIEGSAGAAYRDRSVDGLTSGTGDTLFSRGASVTIQQLLYDWGATGRLVNSAKMRQLYEALLVNEAQEEQALLVSKTYIELIGARLKANVYANKIGYLLHYGKYATERKPADGNINEAVIRGKLANARADHEKGLAQVEALEKRFQLLTLKNPNSLVLPALPRIGGAYVDTNSSPGVLAAQQAVKASQENVEALKKDLLPTFSLELRAGAGEDVLGIKGPDNELSALAVLRWNPFDGGRKRAAVRKAQAQVAEEIAIVEDIKLAINDRVASAMAQSKGAYRRYDELSSSISGLNTAVNDHESLFLKVPDKVTPLSMVSIQTERTDAQIEFVDAQVDRYVSAYTVLAAGGQLLDYFNIREVPPTAALVARP